MSRLLSSFAAAVLLLHSPFPPIHFLGCGIALAQAEPPSTKLDRFPPLSVEQAAQSFEIADGYRIELVAAEPLVVDPVAFCFDAKGRLVVVEMRGYSERPDDQMGRLRRLTDTDADGRMDQVETLAEGLSWPTAVECWGEGIVVATAPDLLYFSEDGSQRRVLCSGFGKTNVQGLVNSLRYGLDLRLHGATSSSGAEIVGLGHDTPLRLGGRDFAIDTSTEQLLAVDGGGQHGMMIDAWGDKYVCSNSDHLQQVLMLDSTPYRTSPHRPGQLSSEVARRRSIASDGPQAEVYRASPVEPWRILRTHLRVTGQATGPIEGGGRAAGYFTGATGIWVYEDDQWPATDYPIALVCDVGSNLVHRKFLQPQGLMNIGVRIDQESEFLRSTDTWFRPVQLGCGPDGALYIADMYREVIEHPKSLPPIIKSQVDLNSGNDKGRIWRIVAEGRPLRRQNPNLDEVDSAKLVSFLDSKNAWQRRTAARLLVNRNDAATILKEVGDTVSAGQYAEGRLQALMTLNALKVKWSAKTDQTDNVATSAQFSKTLGEALKIALADQHARIRQAAIQLSAMNSEVLPNMEEATWTTLANDPSLHVRFQLAVDAGILLPQPARRADLLHLIFLQDASDPYIRWAVEGSLLDAADQFLQILLDDNDQEVQSKASLSIGLNIALYQILRQQPTDSASESIDTLIGLLKAARDDDAEHLWLAVSQAVERARRDGANAGLAQWVLQSVVPELQSVLQSAKGPSSLLGHQMKMVRWADPEVANQILSQCLTARRSPWLQQLAIQSLAGFEEKSVDTIIEALSSLSPSAQQTALVKLTTSDVGRKRLIEQVISGELKVNTLPQQIVLDWKADKTILKKLVDAGVTGVTGEGQTAVEKLLTDYTKQLATLGDAKLGLQVFTKHCATCHKPADDGQLVGPELKSLREKSVEQILISILDPNREVDPKYRAVKVLTNYGKLITGVITQETDTQMTVVDNQGVKHSVDRADIEEFETTAKSLMPEGFNESITPIDMQHLITYLRTGEGE